MNKSNFGKDNFPLFNEIRPTIRTIINNIIITIATKTTNCPKAIYIKDKSILIFKTLQLYNFRDFYLIQRQFLF